MPLLLLGAAPGSFQAAARRPPALISSVSHALNCLVIFDLLRQSGVSTCFAASFCSGLAQRVSDVLVHNEIAYRDFRWGRSKQ